MSETTEGMTAGEVIAAVDTDSNQHLADVTFPDETLTIEPAEAAELTTAFRRLRDAHRGRYAAPASELPADPVRVATALAVAASDHSTSDQRRAFLEDLVDLQAFVEDDAAGSLPLAAVAPPSGASTVPESEPVKLLERIRWRQATLTAALMGHPSVLGDHNAIRDRWTAIGDARAAIDLVNDYREKQTAGIGAMSIYLVAAPVGFVIGLITGLGHVTPIGIAALILGWFGSPFIGGAAGAIEAWVMRQPWRGSSVAKVIETVAGVAALLVAPVAWGLIAATVPARLGWG